MCGIAGIVDFNNRFNINEELLKGMSNYLNHRGPDGEGTLILNGNDFQLGFVHKRLSIIDLSENAKQPMTSNSNNSIIIFNGEIYNYTLIRNKLIKLGRTLKTNSDTEVILEAYETFGIHKTLELLDGMFAFALWDTTKQKLIIARDRFGEKPLYFYQLDKTIIFSSDIRSFYHFPIQLDIDTYSLNYYFQELSTPINHSIWNQIKKLKPGFFIEFFQNGFEENKYWELNYNNKIQIPEDEVINEAERLIRQSVSQKLVSDVPIGTFLSGGIDSSLITLFAAQESNKRLSTFSVGFEYEKFNELEYANQVANLINSNHHQIVLNPNDINIVNKLIEEFGEPFADSSMIPTYYVSKFASQSVKVVLGGDGGDEIFCGYPTHQQALRMKNWYNYRSLNPIIKTLSKIIANKKINYLTNILSQDIETLATVLYRNMGFTHKELTKLFNNHNIENASIIEFKKIIQDSESSATTIFDKILYGTLKTRLVNDYFVKTDRAAMFASLELRSPFIDKTLYNFTASLGSDILMKDKINKYITKKIALKYFPESFVYRKKQGFAIPIGEWIKKEWRNEFLEVIYSDNAEIELSKNYIEQLYHQHKSGKINHTHKLWAIYVFKKWINAIKL